MVTRILTIAVVIAALGTGLAACGGSGDDSTPAAAAQAPAATAGNTRGCALHTGIAGLGQ